MLDLKQYMRFFFRAKFFIRSFPVSFLKIRSSFIISIKSLIILNNSVSVVQETRVRVKCYDITTFLSVKIPIGLPNMKGKFVST
jgi:hypothetical protein